MDTTRLIPTACALAALALSAGCTASTTATSGSMAIQPPVATPTTGPPTTTIPATTVPPTTSPPTTTIPPTTAPPTTTVPPTTVPPTTVPPTTVPAAPIAAVDVIGRSVFGMQIFDAIDVDVAVEAVSAGLGSPSNDAGWQSTAGQPDCTGSAEFRVVQWGDLTMTFERYQGDDAVRDELSAWTVGDPTLFELVPGDDVTIGSPSNIVTLDGIGIGSTRDDVEAVWANLHQAGEGRIVAIDRGASLLLSVDEQGRVVGFGDGPFDCPVDELR